MFTQGIKKNVTTEWKKQYLLKKLTFFRLCGDVFLNQVLFCSEFRDFQSIFYNLLTINHLWPNHCFLEKRNAFSSSHLSGFVLSSQWFLRIISLVSPHHLTCFFVSSQWFHRVISVISIKDATFDEAKAA